MAVIKGITWDHPRGYAPLKATALLWKEQQGVEVQWDVRTLREFGDMPVEHMIDRYDLVVIDHPYVGSASANKTLVALDEHLPAEFIKVQREESLGPGFDCYWYNDHCRALPVDAAAQVAACRKDITEELNWQLPADIDNLEYAAAALPAGKSIGVPLCSTDIWCVFLSLCALYSDGRFFSDKGVEKEVGVWAFEQISSWKTFLYKDSFSMNPIQMLEHMAANDDIVYIPFTFGYTNYARRGWRTKLIHFCDSPKYNKSRHSSLLGGAGLAISSKTKHLHECLEYLQFTLSRNVQQGVYFSEQGQPAHLSAWVDKENDNACSGFFSGTLDTMLNAYVRPRYNRFNVFQEQAADLIHEAVCADMRAAIIVTKLNLMYQTIVNA